MILCGHTAKVGPFRIDYVIKGRDTLAFSLVEMEQ